MNASEIKIAVDQLNVDLCNEYKHLAFYLHAANMVVGLERIYLAPLLAEHSTGELNHVNQFMQKIRGYGGVPLSMKHSNNYADNLTKGVDILNYAINMEREVVANYHARRKWAEECSEPDVSLIVFYEDQVEDSQRDIDQLVQILDLK
jgi:bacterioferritin (cytochrome b1)